MQIQFKKVLNIEIITAIVIVLSVIISYGYLTGTNVFTMIYGLIGLGLHTLDLATYQCQVNGFQNCVEDPKTGIVSHGSCMYGYTQSGNTCTLIHVTNPPKSSVGTGTCPYGTVKDPNTGSCVSSYTPVGGNCPTGTVSAGGQCFPEGRANYGEIPVPPSNTCNPTQLVNGYTQTPTGCLPPKCVVGTNCQLQQCTYTYDLVKLSVVACVPQGGNKSVTLPNYYPNYGGGQQPIVCNSPNTLVNGVCTPPSSTNNKLPDCPQGLTHDTFGNCYNPNIPTFNPAVVGSQCTNIDQTTGICLDNAGQADPNVLNTQLAALQQQLQSATYANQISQLQTQVAMYQALLTANQASQSTNPIWGFITSNPITVVFIGIMLLFAVFIIRVIRKR